MSRPRLPPQERNAALMNFLEEKGWRKVANGWRHPNLTTTWGLVDAVQLQGEADTKKDCPVARALRGNRPEPEVPNHA